MWFQEKGKYFQCTINCLLKKKWWWYLTSKFSSLLLLQESRGGNRVIKINILKSKELFFTLLWGCSQWADFLGYAILSSVWHYKILLFLTSFAHFDSFSVALQLLHQHLTVYVYGMSAQHHSEPCWDAWSGDNHTGSEARNTGTLVQHFTKLTYCCYEKWLPRYLVPCRSVFLYWCKLYFGHYTSYIQLILSSCCMLSTPYCAF